METKGGLRFSLKSKISNDLNLNCSPERLFLSISVLCDSWVDSRPIPISRIGCKFRLDKTFESAQTKPPAMQPTTLDTDTISLARILERSNRHSSRRAWSCCDPQGGS